MKNTLVSVQAVTKYGGGLQVLWSELVNSWVLAFRPLPGEPLGFSSSVTTGSLEPMFTTPLSGTRPPNHRASSVSARWTFRGHQNRWSSLARWLYRARNELGSVLCASLASTGPTSSCHCEMALGPRNARTKRGIWDSVHLSSSTGIAVETSDPWTVNKKKDFKETQSKSKYQGV